MNKTKVDEVKLGGARKKNGHKSTCSCHICENMNNKAKRGGYSEELEKQAEYISGGYKKKNGHRKYCKCPICKNMNNSKKNKKGGKRRSRKIRGGNDEGSEEEKEKEEETDETEDMAPYDEDSESDDESKDTNEDNNVEEDTNDENNTKDDNDSDVKKGGKKKKGNGHKSHCKCPICKNMKKTGGGNVFLNEEEIKEQTDFQGGKKKKKGNGHKPDCKCPICKNMRKKGGQEPIESMPDQSSEETKATDEEYDQLETVQNSTGGTRKNKRGGKKWGGKTKRRRH